jgi:hypothetical protein
MNERIVFEVIPNVPGSDPRLLSDLEDLFPCIQELQERHAEYVKKHREEWEGDLNRVADVGFSFYVRKEADNLALIGACSRGWVAYRMEPKPIERLNQRTREGQLVAILLPDWTEYFDTELMPRTAILNVVQRWLQSPPGTPLI